MTYEDDPYKQEFAAINPYIIVAGLLLRRVPWDLKLESWRSRGKLRRLRDRNKGERAVILCNGPSLLKVDFNLLDGVFTFGLNKINLLFDKTTLRPSCIVAVNKFVIEQNRAFYEATDIPLFLDSYASGKVTSRDDRCFLHSSTAPRFARDCSWSIYQGHTVTYVALQLAFHLGFESVALVGCDHNFASKGPANAVTTAGDQDPDHFDPNYFAGGVKWQLPDLFESELAYMRARRAYEAFDRRVVNATDGGKLEVFERQSLAEFLGRE